MTVTAGPALAYEAVSGQDSDAFKKFKFFDAAKAHSTIIFVWILPFIFLSKYGFRKY